MMQSFRRCAAAGLCAAALMSALVAHPLQARAASAALAAVGAGVTVAAFLMACGVYPYAEGESFAEWAAQDLEALWQQFTQAHATQVAYSSIKAFVLGGVLCYPRVTWDVLRDFASWIVSTFSVTDSQTGVELGTVSFPLLRINRIDTLTLSGLASQGTLINRDTIYSYTRYLGASTSDVFTGLYSQGSGSNAYNLFVASDSPANYYFNHKDSALGSQSFERGSLHYDSSYAFYFGTYSNFYFSSHGATSVPLFSNFAAAVAAFQTGGSLSGITADTTMVSVPVALPEGAEFGGLQVAELGQGATADALEDTIGSGVVEHQRPIVRPVEVEVQQGLDVDASTGEIAENPVVITPTDIPLVASDYSIPGLSSVFPFSIPWDIMRVFQALDAEPINPLDGVSLTLDIPWLFGDSPPVVELGLGAFPAAVAEKMDDLLAMVRAFLLVIACVAWLIFVSGFIRF